LQPQELELKIKKVETIQNYYESWRSHKPESLVVNWIPWYSSNGDPWPVLKAVNFKLCATHDWRLKNSSMHFSVSQILVLVTISSPLGPFRMN